MNTTFKYSISGSFHLLRLMFDDYVLFLVETIHTEDQMKDFMRNLINDAPPQITAFTGKSLCVFKYRFCFDGFTPFKYAAK